jgi:UDP:flavonoid glycosyltransferase YjiC (YdhE family)
MARLLQRKGYSVHYALPKRFSKAIAFQGFCHIPVPNLDKDASYTLRLNDTVYGMIDEFDPCLFLLEVGFWDWALFIYSFERKFAVFDVSVSEDKSAFIPPYYSKIIPNFNIRTFILTEWVWSVKYLKNALSLKSRIRRRKYYKSIITLTRIGKGHNEFLSEFRLSNPRINFLPEILLYPMEFEFPRPLNPSNIYLGPFIDFERNEKKFDWGNFNAEHEIILCSLGSLTKWYPDCVKFYHRLIKAFRSLSGYELILVGGPYASDFRDLPANIHIYENIPQLTVLKKAKIMITHGGMNSVKECIGFGVPMLIYPWSPTSDMNGITARVQYYNLGIRGDIKKDTEQDILTRITKLIRTPLFKSSVVRMQRIFCKYRESEVEKVSLLESFM